PAEQATLWLHASFCLDPSTNTYFSLVSDLSIDSTPNNMHANQPTVLVVDVWYIIVGILCDSTATEPRVDNEDNGQSEEPENLAKKTPYLRDLVSLSSTSSWFRAMLAPRIFKTIYLHNTAKSALAVQAIGQGKSSGCVKELQYVCTLTGSSLEELYPPEIIPVLSNLACFTSLERLNISFVFDDDSDLWEVLGDEFLDDFNSDARVAEEQAEKEPWRKSMSSSLRAIASNYDPQRHPNGTDRNLPRGFTIHGLAPIALTTYHEPVWGYFLSQIKSFSMTLPNLDNGAGWQLITQPSYWGFAEYLGPWFFNHLHAAESLSFDPCESGILGDSGDRFDPGIGLHEANMPNLRSVNLSNLALCAELSNFLAQHLSTLESITLRHCHAYCYAFDNGEASFLWKHLFQVLIAASPPRLTAFEVVDEYEETAKLLQLHDDWTDKDLVLQAKAKMEREPRVRAFKYAYLDDKYGFRYTQAEEGIKFFLKGEDDMSYKELMAIVERNARGEPVMHE
ncbi:hypothetical protein BJX63DRAFT_27764, partial [Aspergillus granulosus]